MRTIVIIRNHLLLFGLVFSAKHVFSRILEEADSFSLY